MAELARAMHVLDVGPLFVGWAGVVEGTATCFIPSVALTDETAMEQTAAAMRRLGAECRVCVLRCPVAQFMAD